MNQELLNAKARRAVDQRQGSIRVHGNTSAQVQGARAQMNAAICGIIYADSVKADEEKIQTDAVYVNMTKGALTKASLIKIRNMWLMNELPTGDSRCAAKPPSYSLVKTAISSMRLTFSADIHSPS